MMVNQFNKPSVPWPSTIPHEMPWMGPYQSNPGDVRFNQPFAMPAQLNQSSIQSDPASPMPTLPLQPPVSTVPLTPLISDHQIDPPTCVPVNPFDPNSVAQTRSTLLPNPLSQDTSAMLANTMPQLVFDSQYFSTNSLTHLPQVSQQPLLTHSAPPLQVKRNSVEMEDEQIKKEEPPTKQQLSESKLFKRFGSLHLDNKEIDVEPVVDIEVDSDESDEENRISNSTDSYAEGRKEFNRYVYLLFKDKKSKPSNPSSCPTNAAIDRIIREEREKLSKAVILWTPPLRDSFHNNDDDVDDDDDELTYKDHRDFLKKSPDQDSIIITELEDDVEIATEGQSMEVNLSEPGAIADDDIMLDD